MEFEGIVIKLLAPVSGTSARGEWKKQEVIFEQPGEFSKKICVSFWGDKAQDAAMLKEGEAVKVSANVESREYNGRWFTEVRAWKIQKNTGPSPDMIPPVADMPPFDTSSTENIKEEFDDLPF